LKRILKSVFLIAIAVAMIGMMVPSAFAESEEIDIKIIFVTSQNECENNWDDKIRSIDAISRSYFHQWGIDVMETNWNCIVENDMTFEIQNARVSHDLTILVLDYVLSDKLMETNAFHPRGGHYMSGGDYDVIVTPASHSGYENERSVYVLIQEISHFAVNWYGYSCDVSNADSCVHRHQDNFDNCYAYGTPDVCLGSNLLATVEAPTSGIKYDVMSPLFTERYVPSTSLNNSNDYANNNQDKINSLYTEFQKKSLNLDNALENKIYEYQKLNFKNKYSASELENILWTFKTLLNGSTNAANRIDLAFDEWGNGNHNYAISLIENEISYIYDRTPDYNLFDQKINDLKQIELEYLAQLEQTKQLEQELQYQKDLKQHEKIQGLTLTVSAIEGSSMIDISGSTTDTNNKIVFVVKSPDGNLLSVNPMNPDKNGNFAMWYGSKDPSWHQDGAYTITAQQGSDSMFTDSIEVKIENGVIVPELGHITKEQEARIAQLEKEQQTEQEARIAQLEAQLETKEQEARIAQLEAQLEAEQNGGGCLIATATYGSELAPQVQQLRELRDNTLLNTESGTQFIQYFNNVYYSFSPVIADYERENPYFKEAVKLAITPLISSLSVLNYVDMDSESEVLGYGISLILLNLGMYFGVPAIVIVGIRKQL
jgi:hypothetical protein